MLIRAVILSTLVLMIVSCGPNVLYEESRSIPGAEWTYRDTLDFAFTVTDTAALYNMYVVFGHAASFPSQNIYTKLYTRFPDGKRLSKLKSFDLYDARGATLGKCSGGSCEVRRLLQDNAYFNRPGEYVITLEQFMRRDSIPGLESVGLLIEESGKTKADIQGKQQ